jgi:hypothetical protein
MVALRDDVRLGAGPRKQVLDLAAVIRIVEHLAHRRRPPLLAARCSDAGSLQALGNSAQDRAFQAGCSRTNILVCFYFSRNSNSYGEKRARIKPHATGCIVPSHLVGRQCWSG